MLVHRSSATLVLSTTGAPLKKSGTPRLKRAGILCLFSFGIVLFCLIRCRCLVVVKVSLYVTSFFVTYLNDALCLNAEAILFSLQRNPFWLTFQSLAAHNGTSGNELIP